MRSFAKKCDVSETSIRYYLKNDRKPTSDQLIKIAEANNISVNWLLGMDDSKMTTSEPDKSDACSSDQKIFHTESESEEVKFQENCSSRLAVLFEYIAKEFGTDGTAIENWFDDYKERDPDFRHWRHEEREKKRQQRLQSDGLPDLKSVNGE